MMILPGIEIITEILQRLSISIILLILLIALTKWQQIGLEKMFIWSFTRGLVQILIMALILVVIFAITEIFLLVIVLLFMCFFAAYTVKQRFPYPKVFTIESIAITFGSLSIISMAVILEIIPLKGEYIIPMGGMVIANVMVMTGIVLERLISDVKKSQGNIEAALSLGDSPWNSIKSITKESYRAAMIPTTNRVAVLGIVTIPGLMSGMIIGGANPLIAAAYQIVIFLMILTSGFIGSIILVFFFIKELFTKEEQLNLSLLQMS
ncbi:ABC transporter permease [Candidatus Hodarchaeum mangrovi]